MSTFYVYAYLREDRTPYYIGKGSGDRAYKKWSKKDIKPPKDLTRIIIIKNNLTEEQAFSLEIDLIKLHGRKDINTGTLRNRTNGGEGSSGHKTNGWKWKDESKEKRSGTGNPAFGKTTSAKQKEVASLTHKGKSPSKETLDKRSAALKGRDMSWGDKVSVALKGRKQDPLIVAKRAESCRKVWAAKKLAQGAKNA